MATIGKITRHNQIAGQYVLSVKVNYADEPGGEDAPETINFVGSVYGGPVVMCTNANPGGVFVTNPDRFGKFGEEWVRRFFA